MGLVLSGGLGLHRNRGTPLITRKKAERKGTENYMWEESK